MRLPASDPFWERALADQNRRDEYKRRTGIHLMPWQPEPENELQAYTPAI